jgi:flagellar biosynthesis/type III secretory pathway protein FliH
MTSSESSPAYAFEQLETSGLVRSRLSGPQLATDGVDAPEHQRENALQAAAEEGRAAGLAEGREQLRAALEALAAARTGLDRLRDEVVERSERAAVELAIGLAEQIVAGALSIAPERVLDVVRGALRRLTDRRRITIVLNPDDVAILAEGGLEQLRAELGGIDEAALQADRRVARGGALVQTSEGVLDLQIETQLERARSVVAEELAS